jgi:uncharacterized protein (DUF2141 family)
MMFQLLLAFMWTASVAGGAALRVDVANLRNDHGAVYCELFHSADGFPNKPDKAITRVKAAIRGEQAAICEFRNLSPGTYAVAAFHDEKGTGRLEKNFLGIPKEGIGVSNDVSGRWGKPSFNDSKFDMGSGDTEITLHIHYPR